MTPRTPSILVCLVGLIATAGAASPLGGWRLQDAGRVAAIGEQISLPGFSVKGWYDAVVPGTVLTTLVSSGVYPEPLFGENNRAIPEKLAHMSYWYRTEFHLPDRRAGDHDWVRFNGINYQAEVYVNGHDLGPMKGAFVRGEYDITPYAVGGGAVAVAVHVYPPPHPGRVLEQTVANGTGRNGGAMGQDGPTFVATIGWDWMPGIRDRDTGLWQSVDYFRTGPVRVKDPYITTKFEGSAPTEAEIDWSATVENAGRKPVSGTLVAEVEGAQVTARRRETLAPLETTTLVLPREVMHHPKLWWPNGYGQPNLYKLRMSFVPDGERASEVTETQFGVKRYDYAILGSKFLAVVVNGVPIFCKGGNWGMDEAMKRIPYKRMDAQLRMHRDAHCTMVRNWVGQCTEEQFYDLCDKYGIMVWDDFWLANPADGPIPNNNALFMWNAQEKMLRFRNHPSIAVWCGRNEANPPPVLNDGLRKLVGNLDPVRIYQPTSAGRNLPNGVGGGGPYSTQAITTYFSSRDGLHTEIGMPSIPTLESIEAMMPEKDWNPDWEKLNDDWAEHDLTKGAQNGQMFPTNLAKRYGQISDLADFVRKSQLANYEGYRAMFEGRNSKLFNPSTGVLLWMSSPAQPSFVWQLYAYDLEPNASLFGAEKACEPIHVQYNPVTSDIEVVNNSPSELQGCRVRATIYDLGGRSRIVRRASVDVGPSSVKSTLRVEPQDLAEKVQFLKLDLRDARGKLISDNFYWEPSPQSPANLTDLNDIPQAPLDFSTRSLPAPPGSKRFSVMITNSSSHVAVAAHLQLRRRHSGKRVLPVFYSDNYLSLCPGESRTVTVEAGADDFRGEPAELVVDGWNIKVGKVARGNITIIDKQE